MTPPGLSPEQEHIRQAQRSQVRLIQAFQLYMIQIAHGARPKDAIDHIDKAMDVWGDYQDAHTVEMPQGSDPMGAILQAFAAITEKIESRSQNSEEEDATPDELQAAEIDAWNRYCQVKVLAAELRNAGVRSEHQLMVLDNQVLEAERYWKSYGTAHLRLELAQYKPASHPPQPEPEKP